MVASISECLNKIDKKNLIRVQNFLLKAIWKIQETI